MASHRLNQFAMHIARGLSAAEAARQAGYAESTATKRPQELLAQARAAGLLPTENEVREVKERALREMREGLVDVVRALIGQAKQGDTAAAKEVVARILGAIPQKHVLATMDDVAAIVTELLQIASREAKTDAERAFVDRLATRWLGFLQERG